MRIAPTLLIVGLSAVFGSALAFGAVASSNGSTPGAAPTPRSDGVILEDRPITTRLASLGRGELGARPPAELASMLSEIADPPANVDDGLGPGTPRTADARRLLSAVGTTDLVLWAVPTDRDRVCVILWPIGGTCYSALVQDAALAWSFHELHAADGSLEHAWLVGVAGDEVSRVEIRLPRGLEDATLSNNAVFFDAPPGVADTDLLAARITFGDGSVVEQTLQ